MIICSFLLGCLLFAGSCVNAPSSNLIGVSLPRNEKASQELKDSADAYIQASKSQNLDLHSLMIIKDGKVVYEKWVSCGLPDEPHVLNSISKTFTSMAIGMCVDEGEVKLSDSLVSFFPENLPEVVSDNLAAITVKDLLTMTCGHDVDHTYEMQQMDSTVNWVTQFLNYPVEHVPGVYYCYNSVGTFMLSAIVQKVTGQTLAEYLQTRLFEPLAIQDVRWDSNAQGINYGGWGLFLKTEDLAKMGQLILQNGEWKGKQLISKEWVKAMTSKQIYSRQAGMTDKEIQAAGMTKENSDWLQGYGYQMWLCRNNCIRADGARGQYIIVMPEQNAVIAITSMVENNRMQDQLTLLWDIILPVLKRI